MWDGTVLPFPSSDEPSPRKFPEVCESWEGTFSVQGARGEAGGSPVSRLPLDFPGNWWRFVVRRNFPEPVSGGRGDLGGPSRQVPAAPRGTSTGPPGSPLRFYSEVLVHTVCPAIYVGELFEREKERSEGCKWFQCGVGLVRACSSVSCPVALPERECEIARVAAMPPLSERE